MRRRPSPTHHRADVIRRSVITLAAIAVLVLVVALPLDRAALVASLVGTVAASTAPAGLNGGRSTKQRVRRRSSDSE